MIQNYIKSFFELHESLLCHRLSYYNLLDAKTKKF